jgi:dTDP-4-dehydrorhamnose 3,5-epimerase
MEITSLAIPDVKILRPKKFGDSRGFFSETYSKRTMHDLGYDLDFVQDNQSYSAQVGILRGLHFQTHPFAQTKLVRVLRGRILDVAVDIRKKSPTYGQHVTAEISAAEWNQILVPAGFAHGALILEPDTEMMYKVTGLYSPECDKGLLWSDPALKINWPLPLEQIIVSDKDKKHPLLKDLPDYF